MQRVIDAEHRLIGKGVPHSRWMYICANKEYNHSTPEVDRLGGLSCNREWIVKDCEKYPKLFHTVVDGGDPAAIMFYVGGTALYDRRNGNLIEGQEIVRWVANEIKDHEQGRCQDKLKL